CRIVPMGLLLSALLDGWILSNYFCTMHRPRYLYSGSLWYLLYRHIPIRPRSVIGSPWLRYPGVRFDFGRRKYSNARIQVLRTINYKRKPLDSRLRFPRVVGRRQYY